jgi:hypothetical protein
MFELIIVFIIVRFSVASCISCIVHGTEHYTISSILFPLLGHFSANQRDKIMYENDSAYKHEFRET